MQVLDTGEPVKLAFATPILRHRWPDAARTNLELARLVLEREAASGTVARSNVGGWQSEPDLMSWGGPAIQQLGRWIHEGFGQVMRRELGTGDFTCRLAVTAWANVNRKGDYNRHHTHANNHWSGVYYVQLEPPPAERPAEGAIEFLDPRPAVGVYEALGAASVSSWTIQPEPGLMLLFPSWIRHGVLPYAGERPRISVAFNLRMDGFRLTGQASG